MDRILRSAAALAEAGLVPEAARPALDAVAARYAVAVTPEMAALIDAHDPNDPIARQFIPQPAELEQVPEERVDPIGDAAFSPLPGIVHRYPDRVLLKLLHVCPVYCRFCFRREVVGQAGAGMLPRAEQAAALAYIADHRSVWEVILTGGDPFMLSARRAREISRTLAAIAHVRVVRWHTRVPVVDPGRVTPAFVGALKVPGKVVFVAIHANHPREFSPAAVQAIARLADAGIQLLSQSVLLKGINDDADTLERLMRLFVEHRIRPYYLHQGDLAPGTGHFRTTIAEGQALMRALRGRLSGLAQPTYVLDIPGGHGKVPVGPRYLDEAGNRVTDARGVAHAYPDVPED
jgi:lysine 2,3-aminomutase